MVSSIESPSHKVEAIDERSILAEGPYWDQGHQRLYYVDMKGMTVNSYNPETGEIHKAAVKVPDHKTPVTLVVRVKNTEDLFVVALKGSLAVIKWDGRSSVDVDPVHLVDVVESNSSSRCNDGKADPSGRLWVGTMGKQTKSDPMGNEFERDKGEMFRIDFNGVNKTKTKFLSNMQIPNGLEWNLDKTKFYLVDSLAFNVTEYKYDDKKGTIENPRLLYDFKANDLAGTADKPNSLPDGMAMDNQGNLWIAVYGTGKVVKINPKTGKKELEITLDKVLQPTSVCFGGRNLDILFVTSARVDWTSEFEAKYPNSGKLFNITNLKVKGDGPSRPIELPEPLLADLRKTLKDKGAKR